MRRAAFPQIINTILLVGHAWWFCFALGGGFPNGVKNVTYVVVGIMAGFLFAVDIILSFQQGDL